MKKLLLVFLTVLLGITFACKLDAKTISPTKEELYFAMDYFKILYDYDINAADFAQKALALPKKGQLKDLFTEQKEFVSKTLNNLENLTPPEKFHSSFSSIVKGLKAQTAYLNSMTEEMQSGSSFDEAFAINNWGFVTAQKYIQQGINDFRLILETYSEPNQLKILAATGISAKKLAQDAQQCEYIRKIQESIK